jgi:NAD-dependent dihydropyrimidine dehydrogenase PreA subunit
MIGMRYLPGVVTLTLDEAKCTGCGMCVEVCPHAVFRLENHKVRLIDRDACMECGACARNCPAAAVSVESGVGCATAVIIGALTGDERGCDCSGDSSCCG